MRISIEKGAKKLGYVFVISSVSWSLGYDIWRRLSTYERPIPSIVVRQAVAYHWYGRQGQNVSLARVLLVRFVPRLPVTSCPHLSCSAPDLCLEEVLMRLLCGTSANRSHRRPFRASCRYLAGCGRLISRHPFLWWRSYFWAVRINDLHVPNRALNSFISGASFHIVSSKTFLRKSRKMEGALFSELKWRSTFDERPVSRLSELLSYLVDVSRVS